jgi:hypothetical protein
VLIDLITKVTQVMEVTAKANQDMATAVNKLVNQSKAGHDDTPSEPPQTHLRNTTRSYQKPALESDESEGDSDDAAVKGTTKGRSSKCRQIKTKARTQPDSTPPKGTWYYAVARGRNPGVYRNWPEMEREINGFPGAMHKKFRDRAKARKYVDDHRTRDESDDSEDPSDVSENESDHGPADGRAHQSSTHRNSSRLGGQARVQKVFPPLEMSARSLYRKLEGVLPNDARRRQDFMREDEPLRARRDDETGFNGCNFGRDPTSRYVDHGHNG